MALRKKKQMSILGGIADAEKVKKREEQMRKLRKVDEWCKLSPKQRLDVIKGGRPKFKKMPWEKEFAQIRVKTNNLIPQMSKSNLAHSLASNIAKMALNNKIKLTKSQLRALPIFLKAIRESPTLKALNSNEAKKATDNLQFDTYQAIIKQFDHNVKENMGSLDASQLRNLSMETAHGISLSEVVQKNKQKCGEVYRDINQLVPSASDTIRMAKTDEVVIANSLKMQLLGTMLKNPVTIEIIKKGKI